MTLTEKVNQMGDNATGVLRIGLPMYEWKSEALHGVSNVGPGTYFNDFVPAATSFPTVIHATASFNQSLWKTIGKAVSTEARAMYNLGNAGLTCWSPVINPVRDPRWGRITETSGEDHFVSGTYAAYYVRGFQDVKGQEHTNDTGSRPLKVSACCKHYAAYDVDQWKGVDRKKFDAKVTEQDMVETFVHLKCVLKMVIYIVSDCDSIEVIVTDHKWLSDTPEDAVAQTLKAGLDLDCGVYFPQFLGSSVMQGKFSDTWKEGYLFRRTHPAEAARQGTVLLKNDETLPLNADAVNNLAVFFVVMFLHLKGLSAFGRVTYEEGCEFGVQCPNDKLIFAERAHATILVMGTNLTIEEENRDRGDPLLPGYQNQLITQVAIASKGPVILVIMSAGGVDVSSFLDPDPNMDYINKKIKGMLWVGHPGQEGGRAIADVVFGKCNPVDSLGYPGRTYKFFDGSTVYPFGYGLSYTKFSYKLTSKNVPLTTKLSRLQHYHQLNYKNKSLKQSCPAVLVDDITCENQIAFGLKCRMWETKTVVKLLWCTRSLQMESLELILNKELGLTEVLLLQKRVKMFKFGLNACESLSIVDNKGYKLLPSGLHKIMLGTSSQLIDVNVSFVW
ncbi:hypothetical protein CRYUN_Cryun41cG0000400 [Craigia yunnanensis]